MNQQNAFRDISPTYFFCLEQTSERKVSVYQICTSRFFTNLSLTLFIWVFCFLEKFITLPVGTGPWIHQYKRCHNGQEQIFEQKLSVYQVWSLIFHQLVIDFVHLYFWLSRKFHHIVSIQTLILALPLSLIAVMSSFLFVLVSFEPQF